MVIATITILLTMSVTGGCIFFKPDKDSDGLFPVTDIRGREVYVPKNINGIIPLGACSLRIVSYFDSIDKVIAVDMQEKTDSAMFGGAYFESSTYRIAYPTLRDLPSVGSPLPINAEEIILKNPDIVFSSNTNTVELDNMQKTLGIPVIGINADLEMDDPDFNRQLAIVGKVLGEESRANELINGLDEILDDLDVRSAAVTEEKTAYVAGMFFYGGGGLYKTSGDYLPFTYTGVDNVMPSGVSGVGKQPYDTDIENLILKNPQYIFIDSITEGDCKNDYQKDKELLDDVQAFSDNNVYTTLVYKNYGTNWENQVVNMYYVGSVVHPDIYDDINIKQKAEEIWKLFFQVDLNYEDVANLQNGPGLQQADWWA